MNVYKHNRIIREGICSNGVEILHLDHSLCNNAGLCFRRYSNFKEACNGCRVLLRHPHNGLEVDECPCVVRRSYVEKRDSILGLYVAEVGELGPRYQPA